MNLPVLRYRHRTALCGLLVCLSACSDQPTGPEIQVHEIQSELAFQEASWNVVQAVADAPPQLGRIVPSTTLAKEKEDLPSIVMAPPSEVRIALKPSSGVAVLRSQVAIDRTAPDSLRVGSKVDVEFEVLLDGKSAWKGQLGITKESNEGAGWLAVGDVLQGLPLGKAKELTLRTAFVGDVNLRAPVKVGFGRVLVEEQHTMNLSPASPERPNVVVVVMDTLRADRTSTGDYSFETTPRLAQFASQGIEYSAGYSTCSWTWPSTASMFTGLLPEEHGVTGTGSSYLASELDTLAEVMQRSGMATGAFVGNPLVVASQNFDQGFQTFQGTRAGVFVDGDKLVPDAIEWLREQKEHRFYLYVHMVDPHVPYEPDPQIVGSFGMERPETWTDNALSDIGARMIRGEPFDENGAPRFREFLGPEIYEYMQTAYDEVVWTGDKWFGRLLDELTALGLDEKTVVLFTADHGEELLDHGMVKHSHSVYSELVHVPLVLRGPGLPQGVRVTTPVSNRAMYDTLHSLATGVEHTSSSGVLLQRPASVAAEPVFFSTVLGYWNGVIQTTIYGVRDGDWVLHFAPDGGPWGTSEEERATLKTLDGKVRLFNLANDPLEKIDRAETEPEQVQTLLRLIQQRLAESEVRAIEGTLASGEGTVDMLKAIGYLDGQE